jgi:exosome complex component RRP4
MADFVGPGQPITSEAGYLRGHGAYIRNSGEDASHEGNGVSAGTLIASVAGKIERVNKLITVKALRSRYGDRL